jgi:hypothetical protein
MLNIRIASRKWEYNIDLIRRITVIYDISGTGKTTFYRLIQTYSNIPDVLQCRYDCVPLSYNLKRLDILRATLAIHEQVAFIDEEDIGLNNYEILKILANSRCYLVIISRSVKSLIFGINNIFKISNLNGYHYLEPFYNFNVNFYRNPYVVIIEDSNSGYDFYKTLFNRKGIKVISSNGKTGLSTLIKSYIDSFNMLVIFDGCGIGNTILENHKYFTHPRVQCFAEESFEWILLVSDMFYSHIPLDKKWIIDPSSEEAFFIYDYEKFLLN